MFRFIKVVAALGIYLASLLGHAVARSKIR
jgi:hypothetical protein